MRPACSALNVNSATSCHNCGAPLQPGFGRPEGQLEDTSFSVHSSKIITANSAPRYALEGTHHFTFARSRARRSCRRRMRLTGLDREHKQKIPKWIGKPQLRDSGVTIALLRPYRGEKPKRTL